MRNFPKKILPLLISIGINSTPCAAAIEGQWSHLAKPMQYSDSNYSSMVLNKSGTPYIIYLDYHTDYYNVITFDNTTGWQYLGLPKIARQAVPTLSDSPAIALDHNQTPYIMYGEDGWRISVRKYTKEGWEFVGPKGFARGARYNDTTRITFDSKNIPYIVFIDFNSADSYATVMKYDHNTWEKIGNTQCHCGGASIAIDNHDIPYIACVNTSKKHIPVVLKYDSNKGWISIGENDLSNIRYVEDSANIDIALDKNQIPYIAYVEHGIDDSRKVIIKKYIYDHWATIGSLPGNHYTYHYGIRLVIDSHNQPIISFRDGGKESKATVMKYIENEGWVSVGKRKFSDGMIAHNLALAIDAYDVPYVSYGMLNYPLQGMTVMKFDAFDFSNMNK